VKKIAVIPARFGATRFPGKLLKTIGDKTIIRLVYENAISTGLFDQVLVVTDSDEIFEEIKKHGGAVKKSIAEHASGSDRIAEAIKDIDTDIIVNIQGDEPFIVKQPLADLLQSFEDEKVQVASLMKEFSSDEEIDNKNLVKVVCNAKNDALYFSRSPIPYKRNTASSHPYYRHIGVYAFRKNTLLQFTQWPLGILENAEMLEQLRYLENGISIRMIKTDMNTIGIDTAEDLEKARLYAKNINS